MQPSPKHLKIALWVTEVQVAKASSAQADVFTKDTEGCSSGKSDHWKAKNSHWFLCKCYLIGFFFFPENCPSDLSLVSLQVSPLWGPLTATVRFLSTVYYHPISLTPRISVSILPWEYEWYCQGTHYHCCGKYNTLIIWHLFHTRNSTANTNRPL